jgi:phospholipase/carboxylesterase
MSLPILARLPNEGAPNLLFLLLHGVGAEAIHMRPLAEALSREFPQAAVLCLNAPDAFDGVPGGGAGRQWFSVRGVTDDNRAERVAAAMPGFIGMVRTLQQHFNMDWPRTAMAGFSQGAIMALEAVQAEPQLAGRVLAFSGRHASAPMHAPADTTVHLFHGLDDRVLPHASVVDSAERLLALGGDVTADVLPGIGHELHPQLMAKALEQLRTFLPKKLWREVLAEAPLLPRVASSDELGD